MHGPCAFLRLPPTKRLPASFSIHPFRRLSLTYFFGLISHIAFLVLINDVPHGVAESSRKDRVDGYSGYRFGMTLKVPGLCFV